MPLWAVTDRGTRCGAVIEADDAAAAVRIFWQRYRPALASADLPDGLAAVRIDDDEKDTTMKLTDLDRRLSKLEAQSPAEPVRITVEYVLPDGTVVRRVRYLEGQDPQDLPLDGNAA